MARYIGIDIHSQSSTVVVMGPSGKRIREERLETTAGGLRKLIKEIPAPRHICIEEGLLAEWAYQILEPLADELVVVIPERSEGAKNDALDAWARADELRRDAITRPVFKAPRQFTALREAVRTHRLTVRDMVRTKNRLKSVFVARGFNSTGTDLYSEETREAWISKLPVPTQTRARILAAELDAITGIHREAEAWLLQEAAHPLAVRRLATAPGIGPIRAAQIVATVVSPHRFRTKRQFWSYCGLGIVTRSSSDWTQDRTGHWERRPVAQTRGLSRRRNPFLKAVFKGAATTIIAHPKEPLAIKYQRMLEHTKPNLARLTIARCVAAAVLCMWKTEEDYDPSRHTLETA